MSRLLHGGILTVDNICCDNRFEVIAEARRRLIAGTNIEGSPDEMAVLDNMLFRMWQMGWLKDVEVRMTIASTQSEVLGTGGSLSEFEKATGSRFACVLHVCDGVLPVARVGEVYVRSLVDPDRAQRIYFNYDGSTIWVKDPSDHSRNPVYSIFQRVEANDD